MPGGTPFDLATQSTAAATQMSRSLSYLCYALQVDNYTNQWFYCGEANQYIAPRLVGKIISMPGTASFSLKNQAPAGYSQAPLTPGQLLVATPFSEFVPPHPGSHSLDTPPNLITQVNGTPSQPIVVSGIPFAAFPRGMLAVVYPGSTGGAATLVGDQSAHTYLTVAAGGSKNVSIITDDIWLAFGDTTFTVTCGKPITGGPPQVQLYSLDAQDLVYTDPNFPLSVSPSAGSQFTINPAAGAQFDVSDRAARLLGQVTDTPRAWDQTGFNAPAAGNQLAVLIPAPGSGHNQLDRVTLSLGQSGAPAAWAGSLQVRETNGGGTLIWELAISQPATVDGYLLVDLPNMRLRQPSVTTALWVGTTGVGATSAGALAVGTYTVS